MSKPTTLFICSECGAEHLRWQGACKSCHQFSTLVEKVPEPAVAKTTPKGNRSHWSGRGGGRGKLGSFFGKKELRISSGIKELDQVLGGGMVHGSVILLSGGPGIGKSTLLMDVAGKLTQQKGRPLYISGEESLCQIADRGHRLGVPLDDIEAAAENELSSTMELIMTQSPDLVIVDSIQTLYDGQIASAAGTTSQINHCATQLTRAAKEMGFPLWLVGHVTKDGGIAGPMVLEHIVDAVLTFEGDEQSPYRLLRANKNRFGAAGEIGAFEMTETGLVEVANPSAMFLSQHRQAQSGSCVAISAEGPRSILLEIQALTDPTRNSNARRLAVGVDYNRLCMLLAVLHRHGGADFSDQDVFVNAVGGLRCQEPAMDLPMLLSLLSSRSNRALPVEVAAFGEIGLTGEIRPVLRGNSRIREAVKMGFRTIIVPAKNAADYHGDKGKSTLIGVTSLDKALAAAKLVG